MTKGTIGLNAGKIWNLMGDFPYLTWDIIQKSTDLPDADIWSAIGWLARENKIEIDTSKSTPVFYQGTNFYD